MSQFVLQDWLYGRVLCGCGEPDVTLGLIHDLLRVLRDRSGHGLAWDDPAMKAIWAEADRRLDELVAGPARFALWNWLDHLDLTEHGSMLPGWLTEFGEKVLAALDADEFVNADGERAYHAISSEDAA